MIISFEGLDGCGKSTQINKLKEYLESTGRKVAVLREPGGNMISEKIRDILLDNKNTISILPFLVLSLYCKPSLTLYLVSTSTIFLQSLNSNC